MVERAMRIVWTVLAPLLVLLGTSSAHASAYQGKVVSVMAVSGGSQMLVTLLEGAWDGAPAACGTSGDGRVIYIIESTTPAGRVLMAMAIAAKLSGRLTYALSSSGCFQGYEVLNALDIKG